MQITLNQDEILEALKDYAFRVINVAPGNDITIDLKAGRGENGYTATLDIVPKRSTSIPDTPLSRSIATVKEVAVEAPEPAYEEITLEDEEMTPEEEDALIDSVMQAPTKSLFARS